MHILHPALAGLAVFAVSGSLAPADVAFAAASVLGAGAAIVTAEAAHQFRTRVPR